MKWREITIGWGLVESQGIYSEGGPLGTKMMTTVRWEIMWLMWHDIGFKQRYVQWWTLGTT